MTSAARTSVAIVLGVVAVVVAAIVLLGRDDTYSLRLALDDAAGLRDGSAVSVGGIRVGQVKLKLGHDDKVDVTLKIQKDKHVPRDAQVAISAVNFLGQKQVAFTGGNPGDPAPDGFVIPASRVTNSTDLDQVLNTLDNGTRARLSILVNEAGTAVAGRRWDLSRDIQELPTTLGDAHVLLSQLVRDNHTLGDVVASSDRFIATTTARRADLNHLIDTLGQTSQTVETKRAQLAATLAKAPGTLATLQRFLGQLERTTVPLRPAARAITQTAPALDDTLSRVEGFRRDADPTLNTAAALAPLLTKLGVQATPVIRRAVPTVRSLAQLAPAARPLTDALDRSANNLVGTVENWSQAIQLRDGLSHIFRGEAAYSPDAVAAAIDRLNKPVSGQTTRKRHPAAKPSAQAPAATAKPALPPVAGKLPPVLDSVAKALGGVTGAVAGKAKETVGGIVGALQGQGGPDRRQSSAQALLDYLLKP